MHVVLTLALFTGFQLWAQMQPMQQPPGQQQPSNPQPSNPQPPSAGGQVSVQDQAAQSLQRLGTELNLTPDQKTKLQPILESEIQQVRDLRADTSLSPEQKQAKFQQTLTTDHAKIQAILTPEQQQKLAEMNQRARSQQPPQ
jgi:hypothetical protein